MDFAQWLRARRLELEIRQEDLAGLAGLSKQYISQIERGEKPPPSASAVVNIAAILEADVWETLDLAGRRLDYILTEVANRPELQQQIQAWLHPI